MSDLTGRTAAATRGGTFDEGLTNGRKLLDSHPHAALQQAETLLRTADDPRAHHLAAEAWRRLGEPAKAEQRELSGIKASFAIPALEAAAVAGREDQGDRSRAILEEFVRRQPENLLAATMLAELELNDWQLDRAEALLRQVLQRAPSFLRAIMLLAKCLTNAARVEEAMEIVEGVLERKPENRTALRSLGQLYAEVNDHDRAIELYHRLLCVEPTDTGAAIVRAQELRIVGRREESIAAFRDVLSDHPANGAAWWGLTYYFGSAIGDQDVQAMRSALAAAPEAEDSAVLHIALSIVAERKGDLAGAFQHVAEGKRSRSLAQPYDSGAASAEVEHTTQSLLRKIERIGADDGELDAPIFIVGMPRSGTTLLERILDGHSQIEACGELPLMPRLEHILRHKADVGYPEGIASLDQAALRELGEWYVDRSRPYRKSGKPRFIDKLNFNWQRAGLIRLILPNARIIDLRRDPLDCCWSNFKMMFSEGHPASNDQRDIARFYRDYVNSIEAIDRASPGNILRVQYEQLVDDVETETLRILDFLGLDFEPQCIDFHRSTAAIATPSSEQVRRPLNRKGIGSAEAYREWLGSMIEELAKLNGPTQ